MGQYYRAIIKKNNRYSVYNRDIIRNGKCEYMVAKLTEHSWWLNEFVNAVCLNIYKEKSHIAWVGDYADDMDTVNGLNHTEIKKLHKRTWDCKGKSVEVSDFTLDGKYLINHTKKQFVDCSKFFENSIMHSQYGDWCFHPLPLLTCIGNGLGDGDYCSPTDESTEKYVSAWAWDKISIEDTPLEGFAEIFPIFKEKGWINE